MGSATLGREMTDFTRYHLWRNSVWMIVKNLPLATIARVSPWLLAGQVWHLFNAVRHRQLRTWARAWGSALVGLPRMLARRRRIQSERTISAHELERWISRR